MDYTGIERLKQILLNFLQQGCRVNIPDYGVDGKLVGVGFKPYWTNSVDSIIDRLEFNIINDWGRVIPINFKYITGYKIVSQDERQSDDSKNLSMDVIVYSPSDRNENGFDKGIRVEILPL